MMIAFKKSLFLSLVFLGSSTALSSTAFASNDSQINPTGVYIRECIGFEPSNTSIDYTHKPLGFVSGDNRTGTNPMKITYVYDSSGSTSASISGYANTSIEANMVLGKMAAQAGVEVTSTRSWSSGTSSGVSYDIAPGKFEVLKAYIPAVKTSGQLKYKVYMDSNPSNVFYEYKTLYSSYAPTKNAIHYQVTSSSRSALPVPSGTIVYTPSGTYESN